MQTCMWNWQIDIWYVTCMYCILWDGGVLAISSIPAHIIVWSQHSTVQYSTAQHSTVHRPPHCAVSVLSTCPVFTLLPKWSTDTCSLLPHWPPSYTCTPQDAAVTLTTILCMCPPCSQPSFMFLSEVWPKIVCDGFTEKLDVESNVQWPQVPYP